MKSFPSYTIHFDIPYSASIKPKPLFNKIRLIWITCIVGTLIVVALIANNASAKRTITTSETTTEPRQALLAETTLSLALPQVQSNQSPPSPPTISATKSAATAPIPPQTHHISIKRGDTLAAIFKRYNISSTQLHKLITTDKITRSLKHLIPGQSLEIKLDPNNILQNLVFKQTLKKSIHVALTSQQTYQSRINLIPVEKRTQYVSGNIISSLFEAGKKAGLPESLTMKMADIFRWDIDFALDIRKNDQFSVLYEVEYLHGKKVGVGNILAAAFVNQGKHHRAVRYTSPQNRTAYYTPDGKSLKKAFLRTPVDFTRISSYFGKRFHPILNRMKAHKGVDYAAPRNTPIKASGNGKISFRGRKGSYGKTIIIQHAKQYSTLYAHMSKFARQIKQGQKVRQGQIIGYVGSTGRATGPHLHYEFRVNGKHRNPLTITSPETPQLAKAHQQDFLAKTQPVLQQLMAITPTKVSASLK